MSIEMDLGILTSFIIDLVSEVDTSVGPFLGESWLMRIKNGKILLGPLKEEAYKKFKEKIKVRKLKYKRVKNANRLYQRLNYEDWEVAVNLIPSVRF